MGSYVVHLFAVLFSSLMISEGLRDGPTTVVWTGEVPPMKVCLRTSVPTPDADRRCVPTRTRLYSDETASSQPHVVININNYFCITGMREVNFDTEKSNIVNVALGNQDVKVAQPCGVVGTQLMTSDPIFEGPSVNRDAQRVTLTYGEQSHESKSCRNEYLYGRNGLQKNTCDVLQRRVFEMPRQSPTTDKTVGDHHQLKDIFSFRDGSVLNKASSENRRVNAWSKKPPIVAESNYGWAPNLKLFIGGRPVNESQGHQIEKPPSSNFYEALGSSSHDNGYIGFENKSDLCDVDDYSTCRNDVIVFPGGFELTYDQLEQIFEEITDRPGHIKLIVPSGITGQLLDYFQQVDTSSLELVLQHGVCLLSNGFLVPIRPMLSVIQLHGWLYKLIPNLASESFRLLHVSMWADTESILGMLRCLIKSGKIVVVLPSNQKISFDRFEQHEHRPPKSLLEQTKIELFGLSISYIVFKNSLLELCKNVGDSLNT